MVAILIIMTFKYHDMGDIIEILPISSGKHHKCSELQVTMAKAMTTKTEDLVRCVAFALSPGLP